MYHAAGDDAAPLRVPPGSVSRTAEDQTSSVVARFAKSIDEEADDGDQDFPSPERASSSRGEEDIPLAQPDVPASDLQRGASGFNDCIPAATQFSRRSDDGIGHEEAEDDDDDREARPETSTDLKAFPETLPWLEASPEAPSSPAPRGKRSRSTFRHGSGGGPLETPTGANRAGGTPRTLRREPLQSPRTTSPPASKRPRTLPSPATASTRAPPAGSAERQPNRRRRPARLLADGAADANTAAAAVSLELTGSAPEPRWGHVLLPMQHGKLLMQGGATERGAVGITLGDTFVLDWESGAWVSPPSLGGTSSCPSMERVWHGGAAVPDGEGFQAITFGGECDAGTGAVQQLSDLIACDTELLLWYPLSVSGKPPAARAGHSLTMLRQQAVVFGGVRGRNWLQDVFALDTVTNRWALRNCVGEAPAARSYHAAVALDDSRMLVFGGNDGDRSFNDVFVLTAEKETQWTWTKFHCSGAIPKPRTGHTATLISSRHVLVIGGWDPTDDPSDDVAADEEGGVFSDAFVLDTVSWTWSRLNLTSPKKLARTGHAACLVEDIAPSSALGRALGMTREDPDHSGRAVVVIGGMGPDGSHLGDAVAVALPEELVQMRESAEEGRSGALHKSPVRALAHELSSAEGGSPAVAAPPKKRPRMRAGRHVS